MPDFRRGSEAIKKAQESKSFAPFVPTILWKEDREEKYILILTPIEEVPLVDLHEFIPIGTGEKADGTEYSKFGFYISRKDQAIGEDYDLLEDEFGAKPKRKNLAVAVELEPILGTAKGGRKKPTGFVVATQEYQRKVDKDSDKTETVTAPVIGIVTQAPSNFFGFLSSFNEAEAPIEDTPFKVLRRGKDKDTEYDFIPYTDLEVDLSPVVEYYEGVSYLKDSLDTISESIDGSEDYEAAAFIANELLDLRLAELCDKDRYDEEMEGVTEVNTYATRGNSKGSKGESKKSRPARSSQSSRKAKPEATESDDAGEEAPAEESRADKFARMRERAAKNRETAGAAAE